MYNGVENYNVIWNSPSKDSTGSMPLGNGDIGLNVWVEENGDLIFYVSKTDTWNENMRLLKLGRIKVKLYPLPCNIEGFFKQELNLREGSIELVLGEPNIKVKVWIDANNPVANIEFIGEERFDISVSLEVWRNQERILEGQELHSSYTMINSPKHVIEYPDRIIEGQDDAITWCHRNECSVWLDTMKLQGLEKFANQSEDPLLYRTFGGMIKGNYLTKVDSTTLKSTEAMTQHTLSIYPFTEQIESVEEWIARLKEQILMIENISVDNRWKLHTEWWEKFWQRSYIYVSGDQSALSVTRGYILQRYINACAGRGKYPIKFNGSIFTMDTYAEITNRVYDADYRQWGGPYWFQNTRLSYWPMLGSGDFEMMQPFFKMYRDALELAKFRTQEYYGHEGAFFPETMCFWGTYANSCYGWDREGKTTDYIDNAYVRYYWQSGLELCVLMLEYYQYTLDKTFFEDTLLPMATQVIKFYDKHYKRSKKGKIEFSPTASLETWHSVINPLPEIAGLGYFINKILLIPDDLLPNTQRLEWEKIVTEIPDIPKGNRDGKEILLPAETLLDDTIMNSENPELYAVFPYKQYVIGKSDLQIGRDTFERRRVQESCGWRQDAIQAAYLGLSNVAKEYVSQNFLESNNNHRFPAFWGPNFDWVPDQDHGNVAAMALQAMIVQSENQKIYVLPAWSKEWNVDFKLHAESNTIIEGRFYNGHLEILKVTPEERTKDIVIQHL